MIQIEIVRFSTDNDSIGEVLCKRAEAVNAVAVVMASHNKVTSLQRRGVAVTTMLCRLRMLRTEFKATSADPRASFGDHSISDAGTCQS